MSDVSPPLRNIPPIQVVRVPDDWGTLTIDPDGFAVEPHRGTQDIDTVVQGSPPAQDIPAPSVIFDTLPSLSGFAAPDPVGEIGQHHYVVMSNVYFAVYDRAGVLQYGPAANNTLWSGFGGQCETRNDGDPFVLYDQFEDRWILSQYTNASTEKFNCIAVSTGSDPLGTYHRYAITAGSAVPDYPKYGVGEHAYFVSTRDFQGTTYTGVSAWALNKADFLAGDPGENSVISLFLDRNDLDHELIGDGLLPMDIDGFVLPPDNSPHFFIGSMDDGSVYGADQDALTLWAFEVNFMAPGKSALTLVGTVNTSPFDSEFPCDERRCIPQPGVGENAYVDHQGYRQRPLNRAAYRNFETHQSIVTNQSVEAAPGMSGIRWWEIRSPGSGAMIHQEGTFAPGVADGIHRWFGSLAMDWRGNMALGYSASNEVTYPSIWYAGRLVDDPRGILNRGEGVIVHGGGSQTATSNRWGDYTSMTVDPEDDCTFWYINQYYPATSPGDWQLRVGAFKFDDCEAPAFTLTLPARAPVSICAGEDAQYDFQLGFELGFLEPVELIVTGQPANTMAHFDPNPVMPASEVTSTLTVSKTLGAPGGAYPLEVAGSAPGAPDHTVEATLWLWNGAPGAPTLQSPVNSAPAVSRLPTFQWATVNADNFFIEVASDPGFETIAFARGVSGNSAKPDLLLDAESTYFWRVRGTNACDVGPFSAVHSFTTSNDPFFLGEFEQ